jgi:hypothetical protein
MQYAPAMLCATDNPFLLLLGCSLAKDRDLRRCQQRYSGTPVAKGRCLALAKERFAFCVRRVSTPHFPLVVIG